MIGPRGDTVASGRTQAIDSVLSFSWEVPDGQAGGEYTVKVTRPSTGYPRPSESLTSAIAAPGGGR